MRQSPKIPLVTIGGFLGSGKTTLINRLLSQADGRKIVVFVNDFGEINIDYDLIETVEEDRIALTNGCICCSIRQDLIRSISKVIRETDHIDAAVVEASGVSDPIGLSASLRQLEDADLIRSELLIYIVDALSFADLSYEEREQILDFAIQSDVVLVSKCDLASREEIDRLAGLLTAASADCHIIEMKRASVSLDFLLGFDQRHARRAAPAWHDSAESHGFETWSGDTSAVMDRTRFLEFVQVLAKTCWRGKGIVHFSNAPATPVVFNLVAGRATLEPLSKNLPLEHRGRSFLAAIGRHGKIDPAMLQSAFRALDVEH